MESDINVPIIGGVVENEKSDTVQPEVSTISKDLSLSNSQDIERHGVNEVPSSSSLGPDQQSNGANPDLVSQTIINGSSLASSEVHRSKPAEIDIDSHGNFSTGAKAASTNTSDGAMGAEPANPIATLVFENAQALAPPLAAEESSTSRADGIAAGSESICSSLNSAAPVSPQISMGGSAANVRPKPVVVPEAALIDRLAALPAACVGLSATGASAASQTGPTHPSAAVGGGRQSDDTSRKPPHWVPDAKLLEVVMSVGFSAELATKALFYSGNASADMAVDWLLENSNGQLLEDEDVDSRLDEELFPEYKMVFVVNCELKMGLGKIAAQVAHATLGLYKSLLDAKIYNDALVQWDICGEKKIVLKGDNTDQLLQLAEAASAFDLQHYVVQDAGRTQIAAGSVTVLSVFGLADQVDLVTGKLKLF